MTNCRKRNLKIEGGKKMDGIGLEVNLESGSTIAPTDTNVPIDEDEEEELEAISKNPTDKAKRKRRTTSIFLSHFDKLPLSEDKRLRAKCKECGSVYLADSKNGTGSMQHHMVACQRKDTRDINQLLISQEKGSLALSAKSVGGRVLDQYMSLLKPDVVEALVCTRDWLFGDKDVFQVEWRDSVFIPY